MVRAKLPRATILTFWHIPWPNPESFGICPWRREILEGMLGSTILGFHTRFHCKNFIETVDRYLEARIEHEHSTISFKGTETLVESYPISIEWPARRDAGGLADGRRMPAARVRSACSCPTGTCLAVGVDRFDYTKGILERLHAVERLLEKRPEWVGRFTFVQVAAPSRSLLEEYQPFQERIARVTERINERFGRPGYQPVHLLARHHEHDAVNELFRAADVCVVTSLHDGMNLVCKEFVAARDDEQGVLILSRFAGAAREMTEALIVNPYHVEETRRRAAPRRDHAAGRAARADGEPAHDGAREQRLSLGRAHADRRRPLAPARADRCARAQRGLTPAIEPRIRSSRAPVDRARGGPRAASRRTGGR